LGSCLILAAWPADAVLRPLQLAAHAVSGRAFARAEGAVATRVLRVAHVPRVLCHRAYRAACGRRALSPAARRRRPASHGARQGGRGRELREYVFVVLPGLAFAASPAAASHWTVDYAKSHLGFAVTWDRES